MNFWPLVRPNDYISTRYYRLKTFLTGEACSIHSLVWVNLVKLEEISQCKPYNEESLPLLPRLCQKN